MNKKQLIAKVAERTEMSKKDADAVVTALIDTITRALGMGETVKLTGLGSFEVKDRAARVGRNPQTKEPVPIDASKAAVFRVGKALKAAVAN